MIAITLLLLSLPSLPAGSPSGSDDLQARHEVVADYRVYAGDPRTEQGFPGVELERVSTAVPWPRGLVFADGRIVALARGRHRNAGGIDPTVPDRCGTLFAVDPDCYEPVIRSEAAGDAVRENARVVAEPAGAPFRLYDPESGPPIEATSIDRPYCTLAFDPVSRNYFICGYSGVDLPAKRFRKNATDSILRYDTRDEGWHAVEQHDPEVVPREALGYVVSNEYYPHHDPATNSAPHGWLNGPDGATVAGRYLYAVGKDNHTVARYDLSAIRRDPSAGAPESELVLSGSMDLRLDGAVRRLEALGPSALAAHEGWLYVGFRTASIVVRFPLDDEGALIEPAVGELIAVFEPWSVESGRSANLIDFAFDSRGQLFVACAEEGRVWNVGVPDPENVFDGHDRAEPPTENRPYVDLRELTSNPRARCGNIVFDDLDRLYICSGNYENGTAIAGVIYRAVLQP